MLPLHIPNRPNDPPDSIYTTIKLVLRRVYIILSCLLPDPKPNSLITTPSISITRTICYLSLQSRFQVPIQNRLPYYVHDIEIQRYQPKSSNFGKTTFSLSFQAAIALALSFQSSSTAQDQPHLQSLYAILVAMVIAVAASFIGIHLRDSCPRTASIVEKIGSLSALTGIILLVSHMVVGTSDLEGRDVSNSTSLGKQMMKLTMEDFWCQLSQANISGNSC
ncbi:conserved hypothetical protein [Ricinus communis]|uniref:Uncharacterized protein n=1 Tax=Ricinus communis TaxID=3988 RepID=B9RLD9_RICCO|nr:conserved hypothetical protein [Ricinus communis]